MSGCGPNGLTSTQRRIEMAAVCQPEAASPLNAVFSAAASSKWKGCGSNSAANRLISSLVTETSALLKRIPNARSSNHSIILLSLQPELYQAPEVFRNQRSNASRIPPVGNCQISKLGGLFAQGSDPVARRQAQGPTKQGNGAFAKALKAKQRVVRNLTHLADCLQACGSQDVADASGTFNIADQPI